MMVEERSLGGLYIGERVFVYGCLFRLGSGSDGDSFEILEHSGFVHTHWGILREDSRRQRNLIAILSLTPLRDLDRRIHLPS
jgi:hypothetical protein